MRSGWLLGAIAVAVTVGTTAATAQGTRKPVAWAAPSCPVNVVVAPASLEVVARVAKPLLPRHFGNRAVHPNLLTGAVRLAVDHPEAFGATRLRGVVERRCGRQVADATWALRVLFPHRKLSSAEWFVFLTRTTRRWVMWGKVDPRTILLR